MLGTVSNIYANKVKRHSNRLYIVLCLSAISLIGCTDVLTFYSNVKIHTIKYNFERKNVGVVSYDQINIKVQNYFRWKFILENVMLVYTLSQGCSIF